MPEDTLEPMPVKPVTQSGTAPAAKPAVLPPITLSAAATKPSTDTTAAIAAAQAAADLVSKLPSDRNTQQALIRLNDAVGFLQKV